MGGSPAYIFVVRHGNRLDAADKKWHLTSPTPYDPPLTYGGFLQARQVGNQIAGILEQAKIEHEACSGGSRKRRRFKVIVHSSPFLRCVQTSIGISSGLSQTPPASPHHPSDVFVSATGPTTKPEQFRSTIIRLDSFLGEWLCPEYFEQITPPPGAALMVGSAKAELLRREDYSNLTTTYHPPKPISSGGSLWNGSPGASPSINAMQAASSSLPDKDSGIGSSAMSAALSGQLAGHLAEKKGYSVPKPNYAISNARSIPDGFVAHARDECVVVDYQYDSMRPPLDFGDGGTFGEEWTSMHKRFRKGLKKLIAWYSTTESPTEMVTKSAQGSRDGSEHDFTPLEDEEVETVVILVSHGAGCNALIGSITHQPVLMDVGIASITMAVRKPEVSYDDLARASQAEYSLAEPQVSPDQLYDIRLSASTDHLRSTASTPVSARSASGPVDNIYNATAGSRGRAPSLKDGNGPTIGSFIYSDPVVPLNSRSTSASAALGTTARRNSAFERPTPRAPALKTGGAGPRSSSPVNGTSSFGLWSPAPSSLRLMDDGGVDEEDEEDFDALLPDFDHTRYKTVDPVVQEPITTSAPAAPIPLPAPTPAEAPRPRSPKSPETPSVQLSTEVPPPAFSIPSIITTPTSAPSCWTPRGPVLSGPIKIRTTFGFRSEISISHLGDSLDDNPGDGLGGLWGLPRPPGEAERIRDLSLAKRRWTTTERAQI
ncbi:hypothetical protein G7046_g7247 [Stylonectria norvegica]|nr:hypothetical protein G7046_g7247 [Stylonectria norvegica]